MNGTIAKSACLGLMALTTAACVSRAQYDRLITEYHSENQARVMAEEELAGLRGTLDEYELRAMTAEERAASAGQESQSRLVQLEQALQEARSQVERYSSSGGITVLPSEDGFRILVDDNLLFASGKKELKTDGKAALNKIAKDILSKGYQEVRIDGHTDTDPVVKHKAEFPLGNHQLAMERALSVYGYLTNVASVPDGKLSLASFGPNRPLVKGSTSAAKARNRRVEIQVRVEPSR